MEKHFGFDSCEKVVVGDQAPDHQDEKGCFSEIEFPTILSLLGEKVFSLLQDKIDQTGT